LIVPVAIAAPESDVLLEDVEPDQRLASWHFREPSGDLFSGAAALAPLLRLLPGGPPLAALALRFPGGAERAYRAVAHNRSLLGALLLNGARERADRRLAGHDRKGSASR
jgi:predicted DCC family thiol-disulfide oxidoreductase YuxK